MKFFNFFPQMCTYANFFSPYFSCPFCRFSVFVFQQDWKVKRKLQLHNIKVSSTKVWRYVTNKGWKALKRKKAVHTSCRHGIRRICKLYTKGRPAGKLTLCELSNNHLGYRWWDNIQRSSPHNTGLAKTATTLHLENCEFRHAMGARIFYTSPPRKCQKS